MENEENRGLIDKKAYEDQLVPFFNSVLDLSHYSPSLSLFNTQIFLGSLWHWIEKCKEGNRKEGERKKERDQATETRFFAVIDFHVCFPCQIWHAWYCMWFFYGMEWFFLGVTMFLAQTFHFHSHGVMEF